MNEDFPKATWQLASAVNTGDVSSLRDILADDVIFDGQSTLAKRGKPAVESYLKDLIELSHKDLQPPKAELAVLEGMGGSKGFVIDQGGITRAFWDIKRDDRETICSIFSITVAPDPRGAKRTGQAPGYDADYVAAKEADGRADLRERIGKAQGVLTFVLLVLSPEMAEALRLPFEGLAAEHSAVFEVRRFEELDPRLASEWDVLHFPAIVITKGNLVIRGARQPLSVAGIRSDLQSLGL